MYEGVHTYAYYHITTHSSCDKNLLGLVYTLLVKITNNFFNSYTYTVYTMTIVTITHYLTW